MSGPNDRDPAQVNTMPQGIDAIHAAIADVRAQIAREETPVISDATPRTDGTALQALDDKVEGLLRASAQLMVDTVLSEGYRGPRPYVTARDQAALSKDPSSTNPRRKGGRQYPTNQRRTAVRDYLDRESPTLGRVPATGRPVDIVALSARRQKYLEATGDLPPRPPAKPAHAPPRSKAPAQPVNAKDTSLPQDKPQEPLSAEGKAYKPEGEPSFIVEPEKFTRIALADLMLAEQEHTLVHILNRLNVNRATELLAAKSRVAPNRLTIEEDQLAVMELGATGKIVTFHGDIAVAALNLIAESYLHPHYSLEQAQTRYHLGASLHDLENVFVSLNPLKIIAYDLRHHRVKGVGPLLFEPDKR